MEEILIRNPTDEGKKKHFIAKFVGSAVQNQVTANSEMLFPMAKPKKTPRHLWKKRKRGTKWVEEPEEEEVDPNLFKFRIQDGSTKRSFVGHPEAERRSSDSTHVLLIKRGNSFECVHQLEHLQFRLMQTHKILTIEEAEAKMRNRSRVADRWNLVKRIAGEQDDGEKISSGLSVTAAKKDPSDVAALDDTGLKMKGKKKKDKEDKEVDYNDVRSDDDEDVAKMPQAEESESEDEEKSGEDDDTKKPAEEKRIDKWMEQRKKEEEDKNRVKERASDDDDDANSDSDDSDFDEGKSSSSDDDDEEMEKATPKPQVRGSKRGRDDMGTAAASTNSGINSSPSGKRMKMETPAAPAPANSATSANSAPPAPSASGTDVTEQDVREVLQQHGKLTVVELTHKLKPKMRKGGSKNIKAKLLAIIKSICKVKAEVDPKTKKSTKYLMLRNP